MWHREIGISLCKCSLCDWCAVGLMRPTVARAEAIADARTGERCDVDIALITDAERGRSTARLELSGLKREWPHSIALAARGAGAGVPAVAVFDNRRGAGMLAGTSDLPSLAHFGGVGLKEVEASGAVTVARDRADTGSEARGIRNGEIHGIGRPADPAREQALARALAAFSDDAPMRARIATDARLLGIT
jgi:hypothetical protein